MSWVTDTPFPTELTFGLPSVSGRRQSIRMALHSVISKSQQTGHIVTIYESMNFATFRISVDVYRSGIFVTTLSTPRRLNLHQNCCRTSVKICVFFSDFFSGQTDPRGCHYLPKTWPGVTFSYGTSYIPSNAVTRERAV